MFTPQDLIDAIIKYWIGLVQAGIGVVKDGLSIRCNTMELAFQVVGAIVEDNFSPLYYTVNGGASANIFPLMRILTPRAGANRAVLYNAVVARPFVYER